MARSQQDIVNSMTNSLRQKNTSVDTKTGEVVTDIVLSIPAEQISNLYTGLDSISAAQSVLTASGSTLDNLGANLGVPREPGTIAIGTATFWTTSRPSSDITIAAGSTVSTSQTATSGATTFQVVITTIMSVAIADTYYDPTTKTYRINVPIQCVAQGSVGNVGSGTITQINTAIPGITNVTNLLALTGGNDIESDASYSARIPIAYSGNDLGTKSGYQKIVLQQEGVGDALVIVSGDPLMVRDLGLGGMVDIYVLETVQPTQTTETYTYHVALGGVTLLGQPVTNRLTQPIASVYNSTSSTYLVYGTDYTLVRDATYNEGSAISADKLVFTSGVSDGQSLQVMYSYDAIIPELQSVLEEDVYNIPTSNVLAFRSTRVGINLTTSIRLTVSGPTAYIFDDGAGGGVKNAVITTLTNYIDSLTLGQDIDYSDLVQLIHNIDGVDDVKIPFDTLTRDDILSAPSSIVIGENEFARAGNIVINQWI